MVERVAEGYKKTEVGVIPTDWEVVGIHNIADVKTGPFGSALHAADYVIAGTPIITVEHLLESSISHEKLPLVSEVDKGRLKSYLLKADDIVFSRVGSVDRNAIVTEKEDKWLFSGRLLRLRPDQKVIVSMFLSQYFHYEPIKQRIRSIAVGQTMASLNTKLMNNFKVAIPSYPEQTTIAVALSDVDNLISSIEKLILKKQKIKQGAVQELLTGKKRLGGFEQKNYAYKKTEVGVIPEDWEVEFVKNISKITTGNKNTEEKITNGMYPFFVRSQQVEKINSYSYDGEAVLTAGDGVGVGKVFHYINGKFDFHQRVYKISDFINIEGRYLFEYFKENFLAEVQKYTAKSSVDSIRMEMIAGMYLPVPPLLEQTVIVEVLSNMDEEIDILTIKLKKYKAIKQGMMQELLTGKRRLV